MNRFSFTLDDTTAANATILRLQGRINTITGRDFNDGLTALMEHPTRVKIIDFSEVDYMSSGGFRHLNATANAAEAAGTPLALSSLSAEMLRLFDICGLLDLFIIGDDPAAALALLHQGAAA